jgi:hypothetical protein
MTTLPHDISDLHLAPVVLAVDGRIQALGLLHVDELTKRVALERNATGLTRDKRIADLLETVSRFIDCHGWTLAWDPRGIRLSHGPHSVVLGIGPSVVEYVEGKGSSVAE